MHLIKTKEGSQFCMFHENSKFADECLTTNIPKLNSKEIEVLQIAYIESANNRIVIEFIYLPPIVLR
jgi:hypothetical protein